MWPLVPIDGSDVTVGELNVCPHGKVTVDIDTKVADVLYRRNWNAICQQLQRILLLSACWLSKTYKRAQIGNERVPTQLAQC